MIILIIIGVILVVNYILRAIFRSRGVYNTWTENVLIGTIMYGVGGGINYLLKAVGIKSRAARAVILALAYIICFGVGVMAVLSMLAAI